MTNELPRKHPASCKGFHFLALHFPTFFTRRHLQKTRKIKKVTERSQIILCFQRAVFLFRKANSFLLGQTDRKIYCINPKKSIYNTVSKKQKTVTVMLNYKNTSMSGNRIVFAFAGIVLRQQFSLRIRVVL
jgi:hypothetical protein